MQKKICKFAILLAALFLPLAELRAQTVLIPWETLNRAPMAGKVTLVQSAQLDVQGRPMANVDGNSAVSADQMRFTNDATGTCTIAPCVPGFYIAKVQGNFLATPLYFQVTNGTSTNATIYATQSLWTNFPSTTLPAAFIASLSPGTNTTIQSNIVNGLLQLVINAVVQFATDTNAMHGASNLSEIASASIARSNLGLGTAATQSSSAFQAAGAAAGGDLSGTYPNPTLGATGTAGTYGQVTTDAKGRVTSATVAADTAHGGTGATTAGGARVNLGTPGLADTNAFSNPNSFTLLQFIKNGIGGGWFWTNNLGSGQAGVMSLEDGNLTFFINTTHGSSGNNFPGSGNGVEEQWTFNQLYLGPVNGGHVQFGLASDFYGDAFVMQHYAPLGTTSHGLSHYLGWALLSSNNWQGYWHQYANIYADQATNGFAPGTQLMIDMPALTNQTWGGATGKHVLILDSDSGIEIPGYERIGYSAVTPATTNCAINLTNAQYQEFDLTQAANFFETNLNLYGHFSNSVALPRTLLIYSGPGGAESTAFPTNWIWETNSVITTSAGPTNVPAATILRVDLLITCGTTTNRLASGKFYPYTPSYDSNAQNFFTIAGITNNTERAAINQLVVNMKAHNEWTGMFDFVHPFCGGSSTSEKWNLVNTNVAAITWNGSPTFSSFGVAGDGAAAYGDLGWNPSTQTNVLFTQNSASLGAYSKFNPGFSGSGHAYIGGISGSIAFTAWTTAGTASVATLIASRGANNFTQNTINFGAGFQMLNRTGSSANSLVSGANANSFSDATTGVPNASFFVCGENFGGLDRPSTNAIAMDWGGRGQSAAEENIWSNDVATFVQMRGVQ